MTIKPTLDEVGIVAMLIVETDSAVAGHVIHYAECLTCGYCTPRTLDDPQATVRAAKRHHH